MRIGMIMSVPFPPGEGIGFYVWHLARNLTQLGHGVQIITRGNVGPTRREVVEGIPVWWVRFWPTYPLHVHLHSLFVDKLVRQLEPEIDLFHLHSPWSNIPARSAPPWSLFTA